MLACFAGNLPGQHLKISRFQDENHGILERGCCETAAAAKPPGSTWHLGGPCATVEWCQGESALAGLDIFPKRLDKSLQRIVIWVNVVNIGYSLNIWIYIIYIYNQGIYLWYIITMVYNGIHIYIYIYFWVTYNDLTVTDPWNHGLSMGNHQ